jgi:hypothetical protein
MSGEKLWAIVPVAVLAVAVLLGQESLRAQESWQPARGGASTWGSGPGVRSTSAAGSGSFGDGANWSAGKGSFGSASQPGVVWTSSGSGLPAASKSASGPNSALSPTSGNTPKPTGVRLVFPTSPASAPKSNAQVLRARSGQKSATGPHFGMANGGGRGTSKSLTTKKAPISSRSHASSSAHTSASFGFGKPKASSSGLDPTGESSSKSEPALDGSTGTEEPPH